MARTSSVGHQRIGRIGKRGIKVLAAFADSLMQGLEEFLVAPGPDARLRVGSDVRRVDRADHRQLERQAAGKRLASRRGVARRAIGGAGEIFAARHQVRAGEARWRAGRIRSLEIRKLDSLAFGKGGGIARAKRPPSGRHDRQDDDRQDGGFVGAVHLATTLRIALSEHAALTCNSMQGAIDP